MSNKCHEPQETKHNPQTPQNTLNDCLQRLSYNIYTECTLYKCAAGQSIDTLETVVHKALRYHLLEDDPVISKRLKELFAHDSILRNEANDRLGEHYLEQMIALYPHEYKNSFYATLDKFRQQDVYPFREKIATPSKMVIEDAFSEYNKPHLLIVTKRMLYAVEIFHVLMVLESFFLAINELVTENHKENTISIINRLTNNNFNHRSWLIERISSGERFPFILYNYRRFIIDEINFYKSLINLCIDNHERKNRMFHIFSLYAANIKGKFLFALYNDFYHLEKDDLQPYLFLELFWGYKKNPKYSYLYRYRDMATHSCAYSTYAAVMDSWKSVFSEYLRSKLNKTGDMTTYIAMKLCEMSEVPIIASFLPAISMLLAPTQILADNFTEKWNNIANNMKKPEGSAGSENIEHSEVDASEKFVMYGYYHLIETKSVLNVAAEANLENLLEEYDWRSVLAIRHMKNPFLKFTLQDVSRSQRGLAGRETGKIGCICSIFSKPADEIEKIFNDAFQIIIGTTSPKYVRDFKSSGEISIEGRALASLYDVSEDIFGDFWGCFPFKKFRIKNLQKIITKKQKICLNKNCISNNKLNKINVFSPKKIEKLFETFCKVSFGKNSLAMKRNKTDEQGNEFQSYLKEFKSSCATTDAYTCKNRFMSAIENYDYSKLK